jgi:hypothetical protein
VVLSPLCGLSVFLILVTPKSNAYPARFRQEYGALMAQLFRDEVRGLLQEGNRTFLLQFLLTTFFDWGKTVLTEHLADLFNWQLTGGSMSYHDTIQALAENPQELEHLYHQAVKSGEQKAFQQAIDDNFRRAPHNLLLAGWFHRLNYAAQQAKRFLIEWRWVIPLALLNGLLFWWFSDVDRYMLQISGGPSEPWNLLPAAFLWAAPLTALMLLLYFTLVAKRGWRITAVMALPPLLAAAYAQLTYGLTGVRPFQQQYLTLMVIHLPLLAWTAVGAFFLLRHRDPRSRLQFLLKSIEVIVVGAVFAGVLIAFFGITIGLFDALNIRFPDSLLRLIFAGGLGLVLVIAPVIIYDPTLPPDEQTFSLGIFRLIATVMQAMLPLTLLVLVIYIAFIPANFRAPFDNRDVLITYNVMLFAVIGLLVGATIWRPTELPAPRERWLRRMISGVAALTLLVGLYALAAILYRTFNDRLTPNRLTFIGWNVINIGLLALLLVLQWRARAARWVDGLYRAFSVGTAVYAAWVLLVILINPWLFSVSQGDLSALPTRIQRIVYEEPAPVLLKCTAGPHIYLLDGGEKRWIKDIETFNSRGYVWGDVNLTSCAELREVPDGTPIPTDAGPPPQP